MSGNILPVWTGMPAPPPAPNTSGTWDHVTEGEPAAALGVDGELAFDAASPRGTWYQKVDGAWVERGKLQGDQGPPGERGEAGAALHLGDVLVDLTESGTVPIANLVPNSWVQLVVLSVETAADADEVDIELLDSDGEPISFMNVPDYTPPGLDVAKVGSMAVWPPFMSLEGGTLSVRVTSTGGDAGALRTRVVHGPLDGRG